MANNTLGHCSGEKSVVNARLSHTLLPCKLLQTVFYAWLTWCMSKPCFLGYSRLNRELMLDPEAVVLGMSNSQWDWLMQEFRPAWSLYPGWWLANQTKPLLHNLNLRPVGSTKSKGWAEMGRPPERSPDGLTPGCGSHDAAVAMA